MNAKEVKTIYISLHAQEGENLFLRFKNAWMHIPSEYHDTVVISDDYMSYRRLETDAEYAERQETERLKAEESAKSLTLRQKSHIVNELHQTINMALSNINNEWSKISVGQDMKVIASVPMPDGRLAGIEIKVIAREQTVSHD